MALGFKLPSYSEAKALLRTVGQALFPTRNFGNDKSYHSRRASHAAVAMTQIDAHVSSVQDDVMPDSAGDGAPINRWGFKVLGIERKTATPARGSQVGLVTGTAATPIPLGRELTHQASGLRYKIATATSIGGGGTVLVDIVAVDTGSRTKLLKGQSLRFNAAPAGASSTIKLVEDLDEDGFDEEPFGAYRARVLATFSEPTAGGNDADWIDWMLEVEGVTSAYAYANRAGLGTVDLVALHTGSGDDRKLDAGEVAELLAYVRTKAPSTISGLNGPLRHLTVVTEPNDVEVAVTANGDPSAAFDWAGGPVTILDYTAGTRTVQLNADRPASMKAGHRISFKGVATQQDGREFTIEALVGDDSFILEEAPAVDLDATDIGYSGGPLVTPIREALLGHMNGEQVYAGRGRVPLAQSHFDEEEESTVGLDVLAEPLGPANPAGKYGTWNGALLRAVIGQIVSYMGGVRNYSIPTPAADVEATDYGFLDDDSQIGLITPRSILVHEA